MPISEQGQGTVGTLPGPELSVIVPTFNERDNIVRLVDLLESCLAGVRWELIVVDDDSPDKTVDIVRNLACANRHVRCVQRIGRRGLSSACLEGMLSSSAPFLAVMDGDLQHDERLLPEMLRQLKQGDMTSSSEAGIWPAEVSANGEVFARGQAGWRPL